MNIAPVARRAFFLLALLPALLLCACAGPGGPLPTQAPEDFALTVTTPPGDTEPLWIVLDPDGELRCASGARGAASPVPPSVRRLSRAQVEDLWQQTLAAGWCERQPPPGFEPQTRPYADNSPLTHVAVAADGRRRVWQSSGEISPQSAQLISSLRALVWTEQR